MLIRPAIPDDAAAWSRVRHAAVPYLVASYESALADLTRGRRLATAVAVEDAAEAERPGEVVGICRLDPHGPDGTIWMMLMVDPAARRRGAGSALLAWARGVVDGPLAGIVEAGGFPAAQAWGGEVVRELAMASLDPRSVTADPSLPDGYRLVPLVDLSAEAAWVCYEASAADDPSGLSGAQSFDDFLADDWDSPAHRHDLGRAAVAPDGAVAALALVDVAGERAWNSYTGTRPDHRGRGLATAVKTASLHALADAGVTRCGTGNDAANVPMRAVNRRLGYEPLPPARLVRLGA